MKSKKVVVLREPREILVRLGALIREHRRMRRIKVVQLAADVDLSRSTIQLIEKGSPSVSIGAYIQVMYHIGLGRRWNELVEVV